ncbi:MAG: hypothetical protein TREMPRED_000408 [Tremellales sp. Tagirdzhanova-0007]|nr:MAG: hypothetical protein TREMPRED_000408 [Tremellales sp. Tagirdzhanova-0007]
MDVGESETTDVDPLDYTAHLESSFYAQGYSSGLAHGHLHGIFEGRALGSEKAFEIWEEVGYYEGSAAFWLEILDGQGKEARALGHANQLLQLISTFPTVNPTPSTSSPPSRATDTAHTKAGPTTPDLATLLAQIRARYRLFSASLGIRPRLIASKDGQTPTDSRDEGDVEQARGLQRVDGPMKGVDTKQLNF